ncbi:MAG: hypothetical protein ACXQTM_08320 [Methanosarcinales archaeon]
MEESSILTRYGEMAEVIIVPTKHGKPQLDLEPIRFSDLLARKQRELTRLIEEEIDLNYPEHARLESMRLVALKSVISHMQQLLTGNLNLILELELNEPDLEELYS